MIDAKTIGARIAKAMAECKIKNSTALAEEIIAAAQRLGKPVPKTSRQTVNNWIGGEIIPPWDKVELLAIVFREKGKGAYDEEWIVFGDKRQEQIDREKPLLVYLTREEAELVNDYRHSNDHGKRSIRISAKAIRQDQPAPDAGVHLMRRSTDLKP